VQALDFICKNERLYEEVIKPKLLDLKYFGKNNIAESPILDQID
jgi:hypothetical protein